jgi:hypothetical protein
MWFESLMGFPEVSPAQVRENLSVEGETLTSLVNGKIYRCGRLEVAGLQELRDRFPKELTGSIQVSEAIGNVQDFHLAPANAGAMFQAASQFNMLEMVSPDVSPERGVGIYEYDRTQGPACAIACGAGTIYRNYFVPVNGQVGQSRDNQLDGLQGIGEWLGNSERQLWTMKNGYALVNREGLVYINERLSALTPAEYEALKGKLRIGLQWDTEVTLHNCGHRVSQAYCSALPVAYTQLEADLWEKFARLILESTYETTFMAALINRQRTGNNRLFLTLVGGGVFGNRPEWITGAILSALRKFQTTDLDVQIVSYGSSDPRVRTLLSQL